MTEKNTNQWPVEHAEVRARHDRFANALLAVYDWAPLAREAAQTLGLTLDRAALLVGEHTFLFHSKEGVVVERAAVHPAFLPMLASEGAWVCGDPRFLRLSSGFLPKMPVTSPGVPGLAMELEIVTRALQRADGCADDVARLHVLRKSWPAAVVPALLRHAANPSITFSLWEREIRLTVRRPMESHGSLERDLTAAGFKVHGQDPAEWVLHETRTQEASKG